jgi:hypothetical protein
MVEDIMREEELRAIQTGDGVVRWKHAGDKAEVLEFCRELVRRLEPILCRLVIPFDYEPAKRFRVPVTIPGLYGDPVVIHLAGETDLITKPERFWVWDLKGTRDDSYWRKTMMQLVFYDLYILNAFGEPTEKVGLIQPMCKEPVLQWQVTEQMRSELMQRVIRMAHDIWRKDYSFAEKASACTYCPVRHACEKFNPKKISDERRLTLSSMREMAGKPPAA